MLIPITTATTVLGGVCMLRIGSILMANGNYLCNQASLSLVREVMEYNKTFKQVAKEYFRPLVWLLAFVFLVYETIWDWSIRLLAHLDAYRVARALENRIRKLPPYPALMIFLLPDLFIIPAKIFAMSCVASGHVIVGVGILVLAKVVGIAVVAYLFSLTRESLMCLGWFVKLYNWVMGYRNRIHACLDSWEMYQDIKTKVKNFGRIFKVRVARYGR